jgi:hypothetical protein
MSAERKFVFKPAVLDNEYLLIGLAGGTGSGKTYSAMRMATGLAAGKRFALIDTENGRSRHYARQFAFDRTDLTAPFRPDAYQDAIQAAAAEGYPVIVVDSMTHVWDGEGGVLEWQEEELDRMAGDDWKKREACKMAAWIKPKMAHKKMVSRLLQIRAHLILCFRAEEKVEMQRDPADKKMKIVPKTSPVGLNGWIPICEKKLPFELTASFLLTNDAPGVPKPIKLEEQHRPFFPFDQPISEKSGELFGAWARGDATAPASEADQLLDGYARCVDESTFEQLEKRRSEFWKGSSPHKARVKQASDAARKRLDEAKAPASATDADSKSAGAPDNAAWIKAFSEQTVRADLKQQWEQCLVAYGDRVPPEVFDAHEAAGERIAEREAMNDL